MSEEFAYREGEGVGDKTLEYWKNTHRDFFNNQLKEYEMVFNEDMEVVLEYFEVLYS